MLTVMFFIVMLSASMLNVFILSVVAPLEEPKPFSWLFCMFCYYVVGILTAHASPRLIKLFTSVALS
jgi:hypothetical protein